MKLDYSIYRFSRWELLRYCGEALAVALLINLLCYRALWALGLIPLLMPVYLYYKKKQLIERRRIRLQFVFQDALTSLSAALKAGYSMENAIGECVKELRGMYEEKEPLLQEFYYIQSQIAVSVPVERLLRELGSRSCVEDIQDFAGVYEIAKRSGGNMSRILQSTIRRLNDKIEVQKEVEACVAAKRMEQTIMSIVPCGIILYMQLVSPGFLDVLYRDLLGVVIMTVCLAGYGTAFWMGRKIVRIEV